jgi:hypothetical protein
MKKDYKVRPYRLTFVNELSDADTGSALRLMPYSAPKVLSGDECASYRSASNRNTVFWSKEYSRDSQ